MNPIYDQYKEKIKKEDLTNGTYYQPYLLDSQRPMHECYLNPQKFFSMNGGANKVLLQSELKKNRNTKFMRGLFFIASPFKKLIIKLFRQLGRKRDKK